jgi:hypothetical protein
VVGAAVVTAEVAVSGVVAAISPPYPKSASFPEQAAPVEWKPLVPCVKWKRSWILPATTGSFPGIIGGLNSQIEHHPFPRISRANTRPWCLLVEEMCREFEVRDIADQTFRASVARDLICCLTAGFGWSA